jgi:hypothetical protein
MLPLLLMPPPPSHCFAAPVAAALSASGAVAVARSGSPRDPSGPDGSEHEARDPGSSPDLFIPSGPIYVFRQLNGMFSANQHGRRLTDALPDVPAAHGRP